MVEATVNIPGYRVLEQIYTGTRTLVYRGLRKQDQQPVVIKLMRNEYPSFNELVQFRNQYTIAKNLDIPGIVQPLSLETHGNRYALVMEDFGGISLQEWMKQNIASVEEFLDIAIQTTLIIEKLHRDRIIHKDIKPANILINPTTKQIKIIDFSIASLLPRETQEIQNLKVLEGTLAYLSPEQTGRMNRGIDYRSDFYSLGVTFFELLTGQLPFQSNDPLELVHCHIAKQPPSVISYQLSVTREEIPQVLSDIVMKLMAKNAEDRYQSAFGLRYDLKLCLQQWQKSKQITAFELGNRDICDRFLIPEKLYGREAEVTALLQAFDHVSSGNQEIILVAGFSGIGKTAVVNEVHKPIVRQRGYFIKGKYDQFQRNIPFSAFVQAFCDLIAQLLSESDANLQQWKTKILENLGENGQVIIDVIPELEKIIGSQPPVPELFGTAAQNRFNLVFQKFIQVFADKAHPLVIFLDDLQWADLASLKLMQLLINENDIGYLLLIGAYRDNEVTTAHPLMLTLEELSKKGLSINTITLSPLKPSDVNQLIAETLNSSLKLATPLAELVYQNTQGNPFFTNQLLKSLYEDGLIKFNFDSGYWQCDISHIRSIALKDDVVDFMALQLQKLPIATQKVLQLAACIGNQFDLNTLTIICEQSLEETATSLWKALQAGLIAPQSEIYKFFQDDNDLLVIDQLPITNHQLPNYKFLHDRVQQAAYSLIAAEHKKSTHLKIGQLLLENTPETEWREKIFAIVNQLNFGAELITQQSQRNQLASLNLIAGQKAKATTAFLAAIEYLNRGINLLREDCWQSQYELTLALYTDATEAAYFGSKFEQMERFAEVVLQQAQILLDKIKIYEIKVIASIVQTQQQQAIQIALFVLQLLDINIPNQPSANEIQQAIEEVAADLAGQEIADLINLPVMNHPEKIAAMRLLMAVLPAAFQTAPELMPIITLKMVSLSINYGNCAVSAYGYCLYGLLLCGAFGNIDSGYQFGNLALKIVSKFDAKELQAKIFTVVNAHIKFWKEHLMNTLSPALEGYAMGLEMGDSEYAGYCAYIYPVHSFWSGKELGQTEKAVQTYCEALTQIKQQVALTWNQIYWQTVLNLQGKSENVCYLIGSAFDEKEMLPRHQQMNDFYTMGHLFLNKLMLCYLFEDIPQAVENAAKAEKCLGGLTGLIVVSLIYFYDSLARLALYPNASEDEQAEIFKKIQANQEKMQQWAEHAPMNFLHKYYLVEAECDRVLGKYVEAMELYDRAIALAKENEYLNEEALIHELAAKFYLDWGKNKIASIYMTDAYYAYARWGAKAKVAHLESKYPQLLTSILQSERKPSKIGETISLISTGTIHSTSKETSTILDLAGVMKAAQAISGEMQLEQLLSALMRVVLENAGATKCALILSKAEKLVIEATGSTEETGTKVLQSLPLEASQTVPVSFIYYVARTHKTLVIDDSRTTASTEQFSSLQNDPYIQRQQPKSLMCNPILYRGKLIGILYLENNLTAGAFTSSRMELLSLLCSQAAISLENARLYQQAQDYAQQLEQSLSHLQQIQLQLVQSEKMSALGNLVAGVAHEINNPVGFIAGNLEPAQNYVQDLFYLINLYQQKYPNPDLEIQAEIAAIDLEYVREDLPKLILSMQEGVQRIRSISDSLRSFSRADTENKIAFNIHEGIDSTILILKHRLKANNNRPAIEVVKNYGDIPPIPCFAGQLNQVFMNLLANAIDALEESNFGRNFQEIQAHPNCITVSTSMSQDKNSVFIRIQDNGVGMSEQVRQKIFDHLFTTKAIGKGTGLGLSIARQIVVEKHGGTLEVNSTPGLGAEFVITIPA
ncbi:serine/threonine protein kinase [Fischerella thermalis CCMEE 5201]|nr:serine/threonine protein kinase [Fischerella thermalis CCMEE 5201]